MQAKKPVYTTEHRSLKLKDLRVLFHGLNVNAMVVFEVDGEPYEPVSLVTHQSDAVILNLQKKKT